METLTAIESRRAVKHFDPAHRLTPEEINQLLNAARLAPTSFNIQNWRFLVMTDPDLRKELRAAAWDQAQVTDASAVFLLCGDLNAPFKQPERYFENAPPAVRDQMTPMISGSYRDQPQLQRDEVMRSVGMAGQNIMLAAKALGYDSCPMIGFDFNRCAELIRLPEGFIIGFMIVVGKALKPAWARPGRLPDAEVVFYDTF